AKHPADTEPDAAIELARHLNGDVDLLLTCRREVFEPDSNQVQMDVRALKQLDLAAQRQLSGCRRVDRHAIESGRVNGLEAQVSVNARSIAEEVFDDRKVAGHPDTGGAQSQSRWSQG